MRYGKFKMGAGVAILATLALVLSGLVTTPASARLLTAQAAAVSTADIPPLTPEQVAQGWVRQQHTDTLNIAPYGVYGGTVDVRYDQSTCTIEAWVQGDFPAGSEYLAAISGSSELRQAYTTGSAVYLQMKVPADGAMHNWGVEVYHAYQGWMPHYVRGQWWSVHGAGSCGSLQGGGSSTPNGSSATSLQPGMTMKQAMVTCGSQGKMAVRLKGKALKRARKLGLPTQRCMPPFKKKRKKHKYPPSITS